MEGVRGAVVVDGQRHGVGGIIAVHGVCCLVFNLYNRMNERRRDIKRYKNEEAKTDSSMDFHRRLRLSAGDNTADKITC